MSWPSELAKREAECDTKFGLVSKTWVIEIQDSELVPFYNVKSAYEGVHACKDSHPTDDEQNLWNYIIVHAPQSLVCFSAEARSRGSAASRHFFLCVCDWEEELEAYVEIRDVRYDMVRLL